MCREAAGERPIRFHQSNIEGEIVNWIHEAIDDGAGILINPGRAQLHLDPGARCVEDVPGSDRRAAYLEYPSPRGNLSSLAGVEGCYRGDRGARARGAILWRSSGSWTRSGTSVETMSEPCIIAVAITGSLPRKQDNPAVPISVTEQIESTHEAFEAGASLVHIHVRNDDQSSSSDPQRFAAVQEGVRRHCPGMIVQFSTGGRGRDPAARGSALYLKPDMASLSTGSVNFPSIIYENHPTPGR